MEVQFSEGGHLADGSTETHGALSLNGCPLFIGTVQLQGLNHIDPCPVPYASLPLEPVYFRQALRQQHLKDVFAGARPGNF